MLDEIKRIVARYFWKSHQGFFLSRKGFVNNAVQNDDEFLKLFFNLYLEGKTMLSLREMYNLYFFVKNNHVKGDLAEVGVYKGGSAKLIAQLENKRKIYLFDSFNGMPAVNLKIDKHHPGDFRDTTLDRVKSYLQKFQNLLFFEGTFPKSASSLKDRKLRFSFVHLDVDLYKSTLDSLAFFYPRMAKGGVIVSHDYNAISCPGVKKAFQKFFANKPEKIIPLWETQCLVIKT